MFIFRHKFTHVTSSWTLYQQRRKYVLSFIKSVRVVTILNNLPSTGIEVLVDLCHVALTRGRALRWSQVLGGGGRVADYDELNVDIHQSPSS